MKTKKLEGVFQKRIGGRGKNKDILFFLFFGQIFFESFHYFFFVGGGVPENAPNGADRYTDMAFL